MKPGRLALSLLMLALAATPAAADAEPSSCAAAALSAVQTRYEKVEDLRATFEQESRSVALGGPGAVTQSRGEVVFAKPGRMRWTYAAPEESLVVSDGEWLWVYDPEAGEAQKLPVGDGALSGAAIQFLLGQGEVLAAFRARELACDEALARLELVPREPATYEKLHLAVDRKTGDVLETEIFDLLGNTTRVRFAEVRVNTRPEAALFRFQAPPGVQVIELP